MTSADILSLVIACLMGSLTAYIAKGRGRSPGIWFFIGMFFGIFGLIALFLFPAAKTEKETANAIPKPVLEILSPPVVEPVDPLMTRRWYYLDKTHKQFGPVSVDALQTLWKEAAIGQATYVWCEGMESWKKIQEVPLLLTRLSI